MSTGEDLRPKDHRHEDLRLEEPWPENPWQKDHRPEDKRPKNPQPEDPEAIISLDENPRPEDRHPEDPGGIISLGEDPLPGDSPPPQNHIVFKKPRHFKVDLTKLNVFYKEEDPICISYDSKNTPIVLLLSN